MAKKKTINNKNELVAASGTGRKSVRVKKAAKKRAVRVIKTRNHGTMTEAAFFGWIKSALRQRSRFWKPIAACKAASRRAYRGTHKRQKFEYQCNICKNYFSDKRVAVDHIIPVGGLKRFEDIAGVAERLFVEIDGLQLLCNDCHTVKTKEDLKTMRQ